MTGRCIVQLPESKYHLILEESMAVKASENTANSVGAEINKALRNFRSSADIENFYRFVFENNLRREAKMVLDTICKQINIEKKKAKRKGRTKKKLN